MSDMSFVPALIAGGAVSALVAVVGWLLKRSIDVVDKSIGLLASKIDSLAAKDSAMEIRLAEMGIRIAHVEAMTNDLRRHRTGEHNIPI